MGGGVALSSHLLLKLICAPVLVVECGRGAHAVLYHTPDLTAVQDTLVGPQNAVLYHTPLSFQFLTKEKESQDLFVSVTEFEKMDPFASYKVKTEVRTYVHAYTLHAVPHAT